MQEREKERAEMAKSKKNITEKKKATKEKDSQRDETRKKNEEKLQQLKPREKRKNQPGFTRAVIPANILWKKVQRNTLMQVKKKRGTLFLLQKSKCTWIYFRESIMGSVQPL